MKLFRIGEIDYPRLHYYRQQHHKRFVKYVKEHGVRCPCCGGVGSFVEEVIDHYWEIRSDCGLCEGTGLCIRKGWGSYMHFLKREKNRKSK